MSGDFTYVIIDIGTRYIRAGIAGQELPHVTLTNNGYDKILTCPQYLELDDYSLDSDRNHRIQSQLKPTYKKLIEIFQNDSHQWMNFESELSIHARLLDLSTNMPLGYNKCKIIIIDDKFSIDIKYMISKIFLMKMGFKSVQFFPSAIISTIGANSAIGLVVELGWSMFRVSSIYDYRIIDTVEGINGLSGENIHYKVIEQLIEIDSLVLEDPNVFNKVEQFIIGIENEISTLVDLDIIINSLIGPVIESMNLIIEKATIDLKPQIINNIIFDGGVSKIPGIRNKILDGIQVNHRSILTLGAWQGASIYFATSIIKRSRSLRKSEEITKEIIKEITDGDKIQLTKLQNLE